MPEKKLAILSGYDEPHPEIPAMLAAALGDTVTVEERIVASSDVEATLRELHDSGYLGAWVNNPHKVSAGRVAVGFSVTREALGLANCISFDGGFFARNTEIPAIEEVISGLEPATALVLGAGQAARSVCMALLEKGWRVRLWNRSARKAQPIKTLFLRYGEIKVLLDPDPVGCSLVVNATPLGKRAGEQPPLIWHSARPRTVFFDMVTRRVATDFLRNAANRGLPILDGRAVQIEAMVQALAVWGLQGSRQAMERALELHPSTTS